MCKLYMCVYVYRWAATMHLTREGRRSNSFWPCNSFREHIGHDPEAQVVLLSNFCFGNAPLSYDVKILRTWLFKLFGPNAPPFWQLKMLWMSTFEASLLRETPLIKSVSKHEMLSSLSQNNVPWLPSIRSVKSASVPTAKKWPFGPAPWNSSWFACTNEGCDPWETKQGWHTISKKGDFPAPDAAVTTRWHRGRVRHSGFLG